MNNFYLYYLRRPDKVDPLDESKGQPFYIGKGQNCRFKEHRKEAERLLHRPGRKQYKISIIHSLWKQGLDFEEEIYLDNLSEEDAFALEMAAIEQYGRKDNGTGILANLTDGGEGQTGYITSEETKEKLRQAQLGKKLPPLSSETKERIRQANLKENLSEETLEKRSKALLGRKLTPEHIEKMRQANIGKKQSPETVEKRRQANLGKKRSLEFKEKMRQIKLGTKQTPEAIEKIRQAALNISEETREKMRQSALNREKR